MPFVVPTYKMVDEHLKVRRCPGVRDQRRPGVADEGDPLPGSEVVDDPLGGCCVTEINGGRGRKHPLKTAHMEDR